MLMAEEQRSSKKTGTGKQQGQVPVTMRAIVQRINRTLAADGYRRLKQSRGRRSISIATWGKWFLVDGSRNRVERTHVNLEEFAKELGAVKPWEEVRERMESTARGNAEREK